MLRIAEVFMERNLRVPSYDPVLGSTPRFTKT